MDDFAGAVKWDCLEYMVGEGLDVGCGDARFFDWAVGIDIKAGTTNRGPNQIRDARKLAGYFALESQDYLFSSYLLQELDDWPALLAGWWGLLKPDGYLIVFLPLIEAKEGVKECLPKKLVDAMVPLRPWQLVEARINDGAFFHVYRKCDRPTVLEKPDQDKVCAVVKLGANGDALIASSVFPGLKAQGFYTLLYCQETTADVLRHDPHIDKIIQFESRVPMDELGTLFRWVETKYKHSRLLVECVEGVLLPSPQKISYHFPHVLRHKMMDHNYVEVHQMQARVPLAPHQKFYPSDDEKAWANGIRQTLTDFVVVIVPNGSSCTKFWPYAPHLARKLLERGDVSVVVLGDRRGLEFDKHANLLDIGLDWTIRKAMTFCRLANVVVGQETGLLNCVGFESDVRKVVLLTHSSVENLTRDWPNTASMSGTNCSRGSPCHRLHYNWEFCDQNHVTQAAACQTAISVADVLREIETAIPRMEIAA